MTNPLVGCRICDNNSLAPVLSLGNLPLANGLLTADQLAAPEPRFPLDVVLCPNCSLVQITETVPPELLFSNYPYFSSFSDTMLSHSRSLAEVLIRERELAGKSLVVELASNDGYLLQYFKQAGIPVLGIEPAANIARVAEAKGIPTLNEFFDDRLAERLCQQGKQADVIIANNVLAHVARLHEFVEGVQLLLKSDGLAVFESAYVRETVDRGEFDQIYHEHLCYYSLTALTHLFARHRLQVVDAEEVTIHGGSIRVFVQHAGQGRPQARLAKILEREREWGVDTLASYAQFAKNMAAKRDALLKLLHELKAANKRIAAYGASAKGAIMLNAFGIGPELVEYVVDRSPHKQGLYMPGVHLPIYSPEYLLTDKPDYALMLAWNFKNEVMEQMNAYRQVGGKFIIPIPTLEIV
ncbi:MAG: class I SAM-dependent methyltransferase [Chloroflexi bacterium]|nr:class I SAM-dependent methyltransferase [Chloroflexota bacterium]